MTPDKLPARHPFVISAGAGLDVLQHAVAENLERRVPIDEFRVVSREKPLPLVPLRVVPKRDDMPAEIDQVAIGQILMRVG